jgi:Fic family protein
MMSDIESAPNGVGPTGLVGLARELGLQVPLPAVTSEIAPGSRHTRITEEAVLERYPRNYAPKGPFGHLKFALRYEPLDLGVLKAAFEAIGPGPIGDWIRQEPTGAYARRAWYLYEMLTGQTLDVPEVPPTGYVDVLDRELQVTAEPVRIRRQRVNDNLLGSAAYCPLIRRTEALNSLMGSGLDAEARTLIEGCDPGILVRAVNYLYTKETKSSFAIEGESPSPERAERFVAALARAEEFDPLDAPSFVRLQNAIVDPRYRETSWRQTQNFVGQTRSDFTEQVHYVCPKPEDAGELMRGWMAMIGRLRSKSVDPVCAAAAASFGFVFIHPFEDGNGRIHRFLIHHVLARAGFTPREVLLPVSAVIVRDRRAYDRVLGGYSRLIEPFLHWAFDFDGRMRVSNATADLYRYWDATPFAEYLFARVAESIRRDLRDEIDFLTLFDEAVRRTNAIVDMPDQRASLLARLIYQNQGTLAKGKRGLFAELSDAELAAIEEAVRGAMERQRRLD